MVLQIVGCIYLPPDSSDVKENGQVLKHIPLFKMLGSTTYIFPTNLFIIARKILYS